MPHQVFKAATHGSAGDLATIADALQNNVPSAPDGVNILAIGGAEAKVNINGVGEEIGIIAMILEPDDGPVTQDIIDALNAVTLGDPAVNPHGLEDVQVYPNVHIEIPDEPGALKAALDAINANGPVNIFSVLSMGSIVGTAHVGLGFEDEAAATAAEAALKAADIVVHPREG
jgi:hypothetical protein